MFVYAYDLIVIVVAMGTVIVSADFFKCSKKPFKNPIIERTYTKANIQYNRILQEGKSWIQRIIHRVIFNGYKDLIYVKKKCDPVEYHEVTKILITNT